MTSVEDFKLLCEKLKMSLKNYAKFSVEDVNNKTQIQVIPNDIAMRRVVLDALISVINMQDKFDLRISSVTGNFLIIDAQD